MVHFHSAVPKLSTFSIKKHKICSLYMLKAVCMRGAFVTHHSTPSYHPLMGPEGPICHHQHHSGHDHCCDPLLWKFWPVNASQKLPNIPASEDNVTIIEEESLLSLFSGATFLKGGSSTLLLLALVGATLHWMRKRKMRRQHQSSAPPPQSFPMEQLSTAPPAFNPIFLGQQRAISHEQPAHAVPPPGPLTHDQSTTALQYSVAPHYTVLYL